MASYEEIAPEISQYVNQATAENFAENVITPTEPTYQVLSDLDAPTRSKFFTWLKWYGMKRKPDGLPEFAEWSMKKVAAHPLIRFSLVYIQSLVNQRDAIINEVRTYGADAFKAHARILGVVLDTPDVGDVTIAGSDLVSVAGGANGVVFTRPSGPTVITRTKAQIEAGGGTFAETNIIIKAATLPTTLESGDEIVVQADALDSNTYVVP